MALDLESDYYQQRRRTVQSVLGVCLALIVFITGCLFMLLSPVHAAPADDFVTTWKTDNPGSSNDSSITIPTNGGSYNYDVDWNNDGTFDQFGITGDVTHDFGSPGTYTIRIQGSFPTIYFNNGGDAPKITNINQWGSGVWRSMNGAFYGASNLVSTASDTPNLSNVTDMSVMFARATAFNGDLSNWDTSNVENMHHMFLEDSSFNSDLSNWDTGNVVDMSNMFENASTFTSDLSSWNTDALGGTYKMFAGAAAFNSDLSSWNTGNVTNMTQMFQATSSFNGDISTWNTSNVTNMYGMFTGASAFNGNLSGWDTSNVTDMTNMFTGASAFNGNLSGWDTSNVTSLNYMFANASAFNGNLSGWDTSNVTNMYGMFTNATAFNGDLSGWDTSNVTDMTFMFAGATAFNGDLSSWNTSSITSLAYTFTNATAFNSDLSGWDTSTVIDMSHTFEYASSFNHSLSWDMSQVTNVSGMLSHSGLSIANYETLLTNWSLQALRPGLTLGATGLQYCTASAARQDIINDFSWTIDGDSRACQLYLNGGTTASVQAESPIGTDLGTLTVTNFTLRANSPYTLTCAASGADDSSFVVGGSSGDRLLVNRVFDHGAPADANGDNVYEVCIRATDVDGHSIDQAMMITVTSLPAEKNITGVSFSEDDGRVLLTITGTGMVGETDPNEYGEALTRSLVKLNGVDLPFCADGVGLTAQQIVDQFGTDPALVSDNPPCYYLIQNFAPAITPTQAQIWLPDGFDITAEGTVSVNGSNTYTFNATSGPITPTVNVNGDGSIDQMPTIPKRPTFSGVAEPGSTITVTVHSDPVVCNATADLSGNWSCTLPSDLAPGIHTVTVVVTSPDGLTSVTLGPYSVMVGGTITNNTPLSPNTGFLQRIQQYKTAKQYTQLLQTVLVGVSVVAAFIVAGFIVRKKKSQITFSHKI